MRAILFVLLLSSAPVFASYTMIRLEGPPVGTEPIGQPIGVALNNNGVALVNNSFRDSPLGGFSQAYLATAINAGSPFATLIPLASQFCCAFGTALNDAGQAAGYGYGSVYYTAMVGTTASATTPPTAGWSETFARAINSSGAIAGTGTFGGNQGAFVGSASGITPIPGRAEWKPYFTLVNAMDDLGIVRGASALNTGGWDIWSADASRVLSSVTLTAPSATWSDYGPGPGNKSGMIAGGALLNTGDQIAWVMTAGGSIAVIPAPGTWTYITVRDINENGDVVGDGIRNGAPVYWTYSASQGFVELGPQFTLPVTGIYAMNDVGQILAVSNGALVLLTPDGSASAAVPEPSSLSLLTLSALAVMGWRRCRR